MFLLHVQELRLQHNVFFETSQSRRSAVSRWEDFVKIGGKVDSGKNKLDYCTAGHFLQQMIPFLSGDAIEAQSKPVNGFAVIGRMGKPAGEEKEAALIGIERRAIARKINVVSGQS